VAVVSWFGFVVAMARRVPVPGFWSSICVSTAFAILSGMFAVHTTRPLSPMVGSAGAVAPAV